MKAFARELAWFFIAILIAIPIAYLFAHLMNLSPEGIKMTQHEEVFQMELFIIGAILGFICAYVVRMIIWAVTKYLVPA